MNNHDEQYRRAWASQLHREFETVCWSYGVRLPKPIIEIAPSRSFWGLWDSNSRTIKISQTLIEEFTWDIVINVLKHEMAHQIVTEKFDGDHGHGESFGKACELIGVPEMFCGSKGDFPNLLKAMPGAARTSAAGKMFNRVRKLLALAESDNQHEALLAMQKANKLIERYNVDRLSINDDSNRYAYAVIHHRKKRIENYQRSIGVILMDFFFVDVVCSRLYDARCLDTYKTIELVGLDENVKIAEYVYYFLHDCLPRLWRHHAACTQARNSAKRSYFLGVLKGFREKLAEDARQSIHRMDGVHERQVTISALVRANDSALIHFKNKRFPRLGKSRSAPIRFFQDSYRAGTSDGRKLVLHKGIAEEQGERHNLLE